ncbi:MAG: ABC transporter permease [Planctomycetota bacterium]|nr:ABC transporter permease [Planctomycetota bacterium]
MSLTADPLSGSVATSVRDNADSDLGEIEICPRKGWIAIDWKELWHHRELLAFLVWRDVKVRYKQTVLGLAWAILQPAFNVVIFTAIFGVLAKFEGQLSMPYALWVFASLLPWNLITAGITVGGMSLMSSQNLLTKIYFPRLFVPTAAIGGALIDLLVAIFFFFLLAACYGSRAHLSWTIVFLPPLLVLATMVALACAYLLSSVTVMYRDFRFVIPFLSQALMYGSAVMIPLPGLKLRWQLLLSINPVFGITDACRASVFGQDFHPWGLLISTIMTIGLFILGLYYFRRTERRFADIA